jgi:hypothetical protein
MQGLGLATAFTALGGSLVVLALVAGVTEPNTVGITLTLVSTAAIALLLYEGTRRK